MYKFFVLENQIQDNIVKILGEDVRHITNVLRLKEKEKLIVCNKDTGVSYISEITNIFKENIECKILEKELITTESNIHIDIYQALPKLDKMEYIIQKATEIGAKKIIPVVMERCIVKLDEKNTIKKIERWQKIAEVAAKQSKRDVIPKIENVVNITNICNIVQQYDIILIAYENEESNTLKNELKKLNKEKELKIGIVIGPEGGISEKEIEKLVKCGAKCITLGKRILRTETASLVILSDIIYEFEL